MDGNRVHTSIVIELGNQEDPEYQKAYQFEFGDLDIPRDYVIDQIFCGENMTIYAVFEITEETRKPEKSLEEPNFDVHGDYRIYRETPSRKLIHEDNFCKFIPEMRSKDDMQLPTTESPGVIYQFPPDENQEEESKGFDSTVVIVPEKISLGTNTSMAKFTPLFYDTKAIHDNIEIKSVSTDRKTETTHKSHSKEKSKSAILKEIKKLQKKINSLIKTIESSDFEMDTEDMEICGADNMNSGGDNMNSGAENLNSGAENLNFGAENLNSGAGNVNSEEVPKNLDVGVVVKERKVNKYDEIPILSPITFQTKKAPPKQKKTRVAKAQDKWEAPVKVKKSVSLLSVGSSGTQIINGCEKSETTLRKASSDCNINWKGLENWRGAGHSKSEMINHAILLEPKYNLTKGAKKSLSLELRDDKVEVICCKKIKNFPFKTEGSLKSKGNMRILPKREPSLRDSLPLLNCEMGDDAKKIKTSKVDSLSLVQVRDKQNTLSFDKINLTPNKKLNEEKGDFTKQTLASARFPPNSAELEVHFCDTTNNTAPESLLKNEKNSQANKLKFKPLENNTDPAPKVCADSEKPTTPNRNTRKSNVVSEGKKEDKAITKSSKKKPKEKSEKTEGKDVEPVRLKSVTGTRKICLKSNPETKTHADKPVKSDVMSGQRISYLGKRASEEKAGNKTDRLRKPTSLRRETSDPPNDCVEGKEKESKLPRKSSLMVNLPLRKSATGLTSEKVESVQPVESEPVKPSDKQKREPSEEPPSVVVELFSEKPQSEDMVLREGDKESSIGERNLEVEAEPAVGKNNDEQTKNDENSEELKKPIVKSLWALTKLILFEDGTQKLEILEASLNPPEWV